MNNHQEALHTYLENRWASGVLPFVGTLKELSRPLRPLGGMFVGGDLSQFSQRPGFPKVYDVGRRGRSLWRLNEVTEWIIGNVCFEFQHYEPVKGGPLDPSDCLMCAHYSMKHISWRENKCRCANRFSLCEEFYCHQSGIAFDVLKGIFGGQS